MFFLIIIFLKYILKYLLSKILKSQVTEICLKIFWWLEVRPLCVQFATGWQVHGTICTLLYFFFVFFFFSMINERMGASIRKQKRALCECFLCGLHSFILSVLVLDWLINVPFLKHGHQGNNCCVSGQGTQQSYEVEIPWGVLSVELSSTTENCERRWPQETVKKAVFLYSHSKTPL